jgi:hypothetical protein
MKGKTMGKLEVFQLDENGAGWVEFSDAPIEVQDKVKEGIINNTSIKMLCFVCHISIEKGNVCEKHKDARGAVFLG